MTKTAALSDALAKWLAENARLLEASTAVKILVDFRNDATKLEIKTDFTTKKEYIVRLQS